MVKLKILFGELTANTATDWFVDRITIKNNKTNVAYNFPCYRWVQNEMVIFEGTGKIDQILVSPSLRIQPPFNVPGR